MTTYNIYCNETHAFEYVFSVFTGENGKYYELRRSNDDHWSTPGEILIGATDNGNAIKFVKKNRKSLKYSQFAEMNLFLNLIKHNDEFLMGSYHVIETTQICNI
jgi:hypothetical protein